MGSGEFLQALLSTIDSKYKFNFSFKTKILLLFFSALFPNYINKIAKSRLELKNKIFEVAISHKPKIIIEIGSGYSKEYTSLLNNHKIKNMIQIDKIDIINSHNKNYKFIQSDIADNNLWNKIYNIKDKHGIIIAEGIFSYINNEKFSKTVDNMKKLILRGFVLISHEPIKPISFQRKLISIFIEKTYRRFSSAKEINDFYKGKKLKCEILSKSNGQIIYQVSK